MRWKGRVCFPFVVTPRMNGLLPNVCGLLPGVHVGFYLGLRVLLVNASTE